MDCALFFDSGQDFCVILGWNCGIGAGKGRREAVERILYFYFLRRYEELPSYSHFQKSVLLAKGQTIQGRFRTVFPNTSRFGSASRPEQQFNL